jgi:predicted transcriptional regulator YheO
MKAKKEQIVNTLKQVADLMTHMFGDNCEVAIHDLTTSIRPFFITVFAINYPPVGNHEQHK